MIRIFVMITIATLFWVPIGVIIGSHPRLARISLAVIQFLAAFPAYVVYPFASDFIIQNQLDPNIWLSPLLVMGTQWYILFNVIVAIQQLPKGMDDVFNLLSAPSSLRWRTWLLPGLFPMLVIGINNAAGGAWNASIEAEHIRWGDATTQAQGIGAYIKNATDNERLIEMALATMVMCIFVTMINRFLWMPLIELAQRRFQIKDGV
jgi:NitT/TauT family transport system permease protein